MNARRVWMVLCVLIGLCVAGAAVAHFKLNLNVRVFHLVHAQKDGEALDLYFRTPMAYLVADKLGPVGADGLPQPAPFTLNRLEDGVVMHLVDVDAVQRDPLGLGAISAQGLRVETGAALLSAEVLALRLHRNDDAPGFATRDEAATALSAGAPLSEGLEMAYVGDVLIDVHLRFPEGVGSQPYRISALFDPGLPGQEDTANLLLDYRDGQTRTYRNTGLMLDPVEISGSAVAAAWTFVVEGVRHILEGLDHVLFVICMVLGATTLRALVARVTGFTLGHTVTLIMGFFGIAPAGAWFIPAVETAIALSIIYAAADAVFQSPGNQRSNTASVALTAGIGLLHGFGFSFMLREILQVDADNVWQSLLAFNIGVELGQLAIVLLVWPIVILLRRMQGRVWIVSRAVTAVAVSALAVKWVFERAGALL